MAPCRCRRSRRARSKLRAGDRLRSVGLHRQAPGRWARRLRAEPGSFRRRLQLRNPSHRKPRRSAGGLQGDRDRSRAVAATRCACAAPPRQTISSSSRRGRRISTGRGRRLLCRAKRVPAVSGNPAKPSSSVALAMRPHVRRTSKRISRSSTRCPATPAHSRESGNPELAVEFFEVLGPRLRGDKR
jgi:hypothetical protein